MAANVTNMLDAIQQLRPQYLRGRGNSSLSGGSDQVKVYLNGSEFGGASSLRTLQPGNVERVEFVRGPDTAVRFGMNNPAGVISITTAAGG
jgi:outer membrane receptor protein involved in Fe transport